MSHIIMTHFNCCCATNLNEEPAVCFFRPTYSFNSYFRYQSRSTVGVKKVAPPPKTLCNIFT